MTAPMLSSGDSLGRALGWTLLHFCWQGAAVAGVLWCVLALVGERASRVRYAACCAALALMMAMPLVTFAHLAETHERTIVSPPVLVTLNVTADAVDAGGAAAPWPERMVVTLDAAARWLPMVWLAGVLFFAGRLNLALIGARRMRTIGIEEPPYALERTFRLLAARLGVTHAVRLMSSARVDVPTVIGWLRPVVLLPLNCISGLSEMQMEALLAHELAHIRRLDYLASVLQSVVEALLFYHPAVWWVSRQMRRERECCCDEMAVNAGGDTLSYARALLLLEEQRFAGAVALGANGGVLSMRIRRLLGAEESSTTSRGVALAVLALLIGCGGAVFARASLRGPESSASQIVSYAKPVVHAAALHAGLKLLPTGQASSSKVAENSSSLLAGQQQEHEELSKLANSYKTWLDQDVVWLITPQERAEFVALPTDSERDAFIEQFWLRRDPAGAPAGTYRNEHYARIAYANGHFAHGKPGWVSDRGHVYIVYGRPDSIDAHPDGPANGYPFEVWHYRSVPGVGSNLDIRFVDTCRCGDYHYTIDRSEPDVLRSVPAPAAKLDARPAASGEIAGRVIDSKGTGVAFATLKVTNSATGEQVFRVSDAAGNFTSGPLEHGLYTVAATATGFQIQHQSAKVDGPVQMNVSLSRQRVYWAFRPVPAVLAPALLAGSGQGSGSISGKVMDPDGAVVPDAAVTVTNIDTGARVAGTTDGSGSYTIGGLAAGGYRVEVSMPGFRRVRIDKVKVDAGSAAAVNVKLAVGATSTTLNVIDQPAAASSESEPAVQHVQRPIVVRLAQGPTAVDPKETTGPMKVSSGAVAGSLISRTEPVYPDIAKAAHVQGAVVLNAIISKTGTIESLAVVSGPQMLQGSAIEAVKNWKYRPFLLNGEPAEVATTVTVNYSFGGDSTYPSPAISNLILGPVNTASAPGPIANMTDRELLDWGLSQIERGYPASGRLGLQMLINRYPNSVLVPRAKQSIAESWKKGGAAAARPVLVQGVPGVPMKVGNDPGLKPPQVLYQVDPEFTEAARKAKLMGVAMVGLVVGKDGLPAGVHVLRPLKVTSSSKNAGSALQLAETAKGLDDKAVEAVRQYRFKPATVEGNPVAMPINIEVNFQVF